MEERNKSNALVSVILPVYNTDEYLEECLDSVVNQSLTDIEIICIDDNSTDRSREILEEYAKDDDRFIILSNEENMGVSVCRNKGLDIANGEYIAFLDSDDEIPKDTYEKLYEFTKENELDFTVCNAIRFNKEREWASILHNISIPDEKLINIKIEDYPKLIYDTVPWDKFIKASFLKENNFRFEEGRIYEDILFSIELYCSDAKIGILPDIKYRWRIRSGNNKSYTQKLNDLKNVDDREYILSREIEFLKDRDYYDLLNELYVKILKIDFYQFMEQMGNESKEYDEVLVSKFYPMLDMIPEESYNQLDENKRLKYDLFLSEKLDSLKFLLKNEKKHAQDIKKLNDALKNKDSQINDLNNSINALDEENKEIKNANNKLNEENKRIKKSNQDLEEENKQLAESNKKINKSNSKLKNEIKNVKTIKGWIKYKSNNLYVRLLKK